MSGCGRALRSTDRHPLRGRLTITKVKLTTIGHSTGVVLAKEALKRLHVGKGDTLVLVATQDEIELTHVDPEVASQFAEPERIMREGRDVLRQALATANRRVFGGARADLGRR